MTINTHSFKKMLVHIISMAMGIVYFLLIKCKNIKMVLKT